MIKLYSTATVSCLGAVSAWLPVLETTLRVAGSIVAFVAGVLAVVVHIRTIRKGKDKK